MKEPKDHQEDYFATLFAKKSSHIVPGLERMQKALHFFPGLLEKNKPSILVAGTNGKGTTCSFLWQLLSLTSNQVALYTSPHVLFYRERFVVGDAPVVDSILMKTWEEIRTTLPENVYQELSFFEISTLLAFLLFSRSHFQGRIFEVGLGGRYDATNIIDPELTIITGIAMDHEQYLGSSLGEIAMEKLGIARAAIPMILGDLANLPMKVQKDITELLTRKKTPYFMWGRDFGFRSPLEGFITYDDEVISFSLPLKIQDKAIYLQKNFLTALMAFFVLQKKASPNMVTDLMAHYQTKEQKWPHSALGRYQNLRLAVDGTLDQRTQTGETLGSINFKVDVCHNPQGVETFLQQLQEDSFLPAKNSLALVSILKEKEINSMLDLMRKKVANILLFQIPHARSFGREDLAPRHLDLLFFNCFNTALSYALTCYPQQRNQPWLLCGSILAIGEVLHICHAYPSSLIMEKSDLRGVWSTRISNEHY